MQSKEGQLFFHLCQDTILKFYAGLLMRPEHSETKAKTETETETKNCYETETKNYETETETSLVISFACES